MFSVQCKMTESEYLEVQRLAGASPMTGDWLRNYKTEPSPTIAANEFTPPDPYAPGLAAMRAAAGDPRVAIRRAVRRRAR